MTARIDWDSTDLLRSEVARLLSTFPDAATFLKTFGDKLADLCESNNCVLPTKSILRPFVEAVRVLYAAEAFVEPPPFPSTLVGTHEGARYRDHLLDLHRRASGGTSTLDGVQYTLINSFFGLVRQLPDLAFDQIETATTIPLADLVDATNAINSIIDPFLTESIKTLGIFAALRAELEKNILEASKGNPKKPILPKDHDGTSREKVHAYLKHTPFEDIFEAPIPFDIPQETRFSGHWIIAPPGRGKTTLLQHMFMQDLERDASIIVIDSKGDFIDTIKNLRVVKDRLLLIEPDITTPIGINPLDIPYSNITHAVDLLEYIFSALLEFKMTAMQTTLFRSVFRALITAFPNPTLETFRDLLTNGYQKYQEHIDKLPPDLQDFFYNDFDDQYKDRRREVLQRLRLLLDSEHMRAMLTATHTRFRIGDAMDAGKVIIINNSKNQLGDQGSEFFARFFIAQIFAAAQKRSGRSRAEKLPCFVYIDECQTVIAKDEKVSAILDECRSQNIALILAHQRTQQITSPNVLSALQNCAIRMANSDDEAKGLAEKLRTDVDFIRSLPRGTFATYVRDFTKNALALKIPYVDMTKLPQLTAEEQRAIKTAMAEQFSYTPAPVPPRSPPKAVTDTTQRGSISSRAAARRPPKAPAEPSPPSSPDDDLTTPKKNW